MQQCEGKLRGVADGFIGENYLPGLVIDCLMNVKDGGKHVDHLQVVENVNGWKDVNTLPE